jgi:predicted metal-dependent hydrolase
MGLLRAKYTSGDLIEIAGSPVRLKVNARASRVSLRVDARRREIVAIAPSPRGLTTAAAFAAERAGWIAAQMSALPKPVSLAPGDVIEVLGEAHRLEQAPTRLAAGFHQDLAGAPVLAAFGQGDAFGRAALRLLRRQALDVLTDRTRHYAQALGRPMPAVAVADANGRWGSCRPPRTGARPDAGSIRYSWRLVLAPHAVADYVAAHECAHLIEANHGPKFWALVRGVYGSERAPRDWLKAHGQRLHGFGR